MDKINSRQKILSTIRQSLQKAPLSVNPTTTQANFEKKSNKFEHYRKLDLSQRLDLFIKNAVAADSMVETVKSTDMIPKIVANIRKEKLPSSALIIARSHFILSLPWHAIPVTVHDNFDASNEQISVTESICGIAETGTLMLTSCKTHASKLNFLPKMHIILLDSTKIVGTYEQAWQLLETENIPRTVNFITGPSRTGDIEQKLLLGAHGPKQLVILIY